jgi:hypothetical protein
MKQKSWKINEQVVRPDLEAGMDQYNPNPVAAADNDDDCIEIH